MELEISRNDLVKTILECFQSWQIHIELKPVLAKIDFEIDSNGYLYAALLNDKSISINSEASAPSLEKLGLADAFEKNPQKVAKFMAKKMAGVLDEVCAKEEFLNLPRASEVVFGFGLHGGWYQDSVYTFSNKEFRPEPTNTRLKYLRQEFSSDEIDIDILAKALAPKLREALSWISQESEVEIKMMGIAWSKDYETPPTLKFLTIDDELHTWPGEVELYSWINKNSSSELVGNTGTIYAQILCIATKSILDSDEFKSLNLSDDFEMFLRNRDTKEVDNFYPLNYFELF